jgi:CBS domain-containing protein
LLTMQEHKIRRLPVINSQGELEGILSMNDIVLKAKDDDRSPAITDVVKTYQAICAHPVPMTAAAAPTA